MNYVRIWNSDDDGKSHVHVILYGHDNTICGHDFAGDPSVHAKPPVEIDGKPRVTCHHCLNVIDTVRDHLKRKSP